ncbi:AHH domain-containing protein [Photobacterium nomapromontoriensis]|uniref:AHH domain-containing protein n=1 Tax=Photobacterium nomapromontoriensis TaxID=2910237 RepID=UPI003D151F58
MGYRENVLGPAQNDPKHPIYHGFKMQVHHLLSKQGVNDSGKGLKLKAMGYDINLAGNLVALPSTLEGACHLKVQLHRGNHPKQLPVDTNDADLEHSDDYHEHVKKITKNAYQSIKKECKKNDREAVQAFINYQSLLVLLRIKNFSLRLTTIHDFLKEGNSGCLGAKSIPEHETTQKKIEPNVCVIIESIQSLSLSVVVLFLMS